MTAFVSGTASVVEGAMFDEGTSDYACVISEELAMYNGLAVGDTVVITNPSAEEETYTLTVSGIYTSSENNDFTMSTKVIQGRRRSKFEPDYFPSGEQNAQ